MIDRRAGARDRARAGSPTRLRALLAGGLVLGVGATITLAAWTAHDDGRGTFSASSFLTQSTAVDSSGAWASNPSAPGASLQFNATGLMPGATIAAPFGIRTAPNTASSPVTASAAGTESLQAPIAASGTSTTSGLWLYLQYRVFSSTSSTCTTTTTPSLPANWIVGGASTWASLSAAMAANSTAIAASTTTVPGTATWFCLQVQLPTTAPSSLQGGSAGVVWQFVGTSS
jgi:predicted ribosomally synthesized peptide with SipW-like signal peptide